MSDIKIHAAYDEIWDIDRLKPNPRNPNKHPQAQIKRLAEIIKTQGWRTVIAVSKRSGFIVRGHARLEAAQLLGLKIVPVDLQDYDSDELELADLVADNRIAELAETDIPSLADILEQTKNGDFDPIITGYDEKEIKAIISKIHPVVGRTDDDAIPDNVETICKLGDLWKLGDHRLLCGDSTNPDDVARLMDGQMASILSTDPPYLVDYDRASHFHGPKGENQRTNYNLGGKHWDDYHDPETSVKFFSDFLALGLKCLKSNSAIYQWHAYRRQALVEQAWTANGLLIHQQIIWFKGFGILTHSHYMWAHEPCFYGWVEGRAPSRRPPANAISVWTVSPKPENLNIHPTQKPVELFARPIEYHTEIGDICYEPFVGSGTQIIAAEKLQRRCYGMELSPAFCDCIIKRYEDFTGKKAELLGNEKPPGDEPSGLSVPT